MSPKAKLGDHILHDLLDVHFIICLFGESSYNIAQVQNIKHKAQTRKVCQNIF